MLKKMLENEENVEESPASFRIKINHLMFENITMITVVLVTVTCSLLSDPSPFLSFLFTPLMEQRVDLDEFVCAVAALHIGQVRNMDQPGLAMC